MVELKLSQGAKPGHGGVLPAAKVSAEIAATRGVPEGVDCISPSRHSAFSTPIEMMQFIATMRKLSGGKPVGFKLCIGHPWEFLAVCKAMLETETGGSGLESSGEGAAVTKFEIIIECGVRGRTALSERFEARNDQRDCARRVPDISHHRGFGFRKPLDHPNTLWRGLDHKR
jgi:hypothetical protein